MYAQVNVIALTSLYPFVVESGVKYKNREKPTSLFIDVGDRIEVTGISHKHGWVRGRNLETEREGVFPENLPAKRIVIVPRNLGEPQDGFVGNANLRLDSIRFCQHSIHASFQNGQSLEKMARQLQSRPDKCVAPLFLFFLL